MNYKRSIHSATAIAATAMIMAGLVAAGPAPASAAPAASNSVGAATTVGSALSVTSISPSPGTYGSGILVKVQFNQAVPATARKAVTANIKIKASKSLGRTGWAWSDSRTAVFRPEKFWPAHTKVSVTATPSGAAIPAGTSTLKWAGRIDRKFQIGRSQVIKIDNASHRAKVIRDGKVIRTVPVSLGKPGWETRSGIKVMTEKYRVKTMTGASIGAEEDYTLQVPYAIRLTNSGEFIHAAPWATSRIGRWNGSHGCTNLLTRDAKWLYDSARVGDPVVTTGTRRSMERWNGAGGPWNTPWNVWQKGLAA